MKRVSCVHIDEPIKIDGLLDEPAWRKAEEIGLYVPVTHAEPISKTEARLMWDDEHLYVGFKAYDQDIWSYLTERDSTTCQEDVLEVFLQQDPAKEPYVNFEINALGTIYDAYNLKRNAGGSDHHRWAKWNCEGLKVGIFIQGTLNDPSVVDEYWQMEIAVPFAELPGGAPKPGDEWKFHVARYDYSVHLPDGVELSSSARQTEVNFHKFEDWDLLVF
ncbi:MAG: carbohydrate-binding family 9-like protein [Armatimonadota bacterium]